MATVSMIWTATREALSTRGGAPEDGETPAGLAAEVAEALGVECDERLVSEVDQAVAAEASR